MKVNLVSQNYTDNYLVNLLKERGVNSLEDYLEPSFKHLQQPEDFDNIQEGWKILEDTLNSNGSILLIVDCDVDGYTSGAIMYTYLKKLDPEVNIEYWLHEGKQHGLEDHIKKLLSQDKVYDLIICPDSSSNDEEYHTLLKESGTKILVLDHHEVDEGQKFSSNAVIINNQLSMRYMNKDLTGAGVAWQFCRYIDNKTNNRYADDLIDLAALGVCGDAGSVLDMENRYIMKTGFKYINNYFFKEAIKKQDYSMKGVVNPTSVAFYIVPMMNAIVRVGTMEEKERLFMALVDGTQMVPSGKRGAKGTMEQVAIESLRECTNAKSRQNRIIESMVESLEIKIHKHDLLENKILFVRLDDDDKFPAEITGLVAMKLAARFKRPTILARLNTDGYNKGSLRNNNDCELTDFKKFLNESGYFEYAQGHANAAGCSIKDSNLSAFHNYANEKLKDMDFGEGMYDVHFERSITHNDIGDLVLDLGRYPEIWGQGNSEPMIHIFNILLDWKDIEIIGKGNDTLKFTINGVTYIKFKATNMIEELRQLGKIKLSIIGKANINEWAGRKTPQIMIEAYEAKANDIYSF